MEFKEFKPILPFDDQWEGHFVRIDGYQGNFCVDVGGGFQSATVEEIDDLITELQASKGFIAEKKKEKSD